MTFRPSVATSGPGDRPVGPAARFAGAAGLALAAAAFLASRAAGAESLAREPAARGALSPGSMRAVAERLSEFGARAVGRPGHAPARSYVGGRLLLAGLKPILTDTFSCIVQPGAASGRRPADGAEDAFEDARPPRLIACGSVVTFAHARPLADAWSEMKGQAEDFTFDHPPRADLRAALEQAARDEGVVRLTPFDVFKRPSPLFPKAVIRCLLRRMVRRRAGAGAEDPARRAAVMAGMLRDLARSHEAVLLAAPLDTRPAPRAGPHGADESASIVGMCLLGEFVACENRRPQARTLICAAVDAHWHDAAGARSLARMFLPAGQAGRATRRGAVAGRGHGRADDDRLAGLLGPSEAAARAPAVADRLEARPRDPAALAEAEDVLVRLLGLEPYAPRLVVWLDLAAGGRRVAIHVVAPGGGQGGAGRVRRHLDEAASDAGARLVPAGQVDGPPAGPAARAFEAARRGAAAMAEAGPPAVVLRTADADRGRWFTADDVPERMDVAGLSRQARAVAALLAEVLASGDL